MLLDEIVSHKKEEVAARKAAIHPREIRAAALDAPPAPDFRRALEMPGLSVIAEIKASSPSAGTIRDGFDAIAVAHAYEAGGAAALSVLTDARYFGGSWESLTRVSHATALPVLCKEFVVDAYQIDEARAAGAGAVLLIAAVLDGARLSDFLGVARERGLAALVEVHTPDETAVAVDAGADIVGINNRNLDTLRVDLETTARLRPMIPAGRLIVSESGFDRREQVQRVERLGVDAVLIGTALMASPDPTAKLRELRGV